MCAINAKNKLAAVAGGVGIAGCVGKSGITVPLMIQLSQMWSNRSGWGELRWLHLVVPVLVLRILTYNTWYLEIAAIV